MTIAEGEGIEFVYGKGRKKTEIQQLYEKLEVCGSKLMEYKECFEVMGKDRNSYSKTDLELCNEIQKLRAKKKKTQLN